MMAVEDHPKWPQWKTAIDRVLEAKDKYKAVQHLPAADEVHRNAKAEYGLALLAYQRISSEIL